MSLQKQCNMSALIHVCPYSSDTKGVYSANTPSRRNDTFENTNFKEYDK